MKEKMIMKKIVAVIWITVLGMAQLANASSYQYVSAEELKGWLEAEDSVLLMDIQVKEEFAAHHIKGSLETNSYPVKSGADRKRIDPAIKLNQSNDYRAVVVVCPRGKGGAKRAYDYLNKAGVSDNKLYILTGGMDRWPYRELVVEK